VSFGVRLICVDAELASKQGCRDRITFWFLSWCGRYKIEAGELLKVNVKPLGSDYGEKEFWAKVAVDGRLTIPKLTMQIIEQAEGKNLTGAIFEVTITPAGNPNDTEPPADTNPPETTETKLLDKIKDIRKNLNNTTP